MSVLARSVNERRSSRTASPSSDGKPNGASRTDLDSERVEPISTRSESNRSHAVGVESESALRVPLMRNTLLGISCRRRRMAWSVDVETESARTRSSDRSLLRSDDVESRGAGGRANEKFHGNGQG